MHNQVSLGGWCSLAIAWGTIIALVGYCFFRVLSSPRRHERSAAPTNGAGRALWATRVGLILAMAGNAIGLGNFLRFPVKAAANGGGAFLIPYFCAFLLLGIPLMWVEWTIGRYGGAKGHGTTPGMFSLMWSHPAAKYLGALGIALPFTIVVYYSFIESWTLAFSWFSASGRYAGATTRDSMGQFLRGFQGVEHNAFFDSHLPIITFVVLTLVINYAFLARGIARGIEVLAKIGMPLLFLFAAVLTVRVLTLGTPDTANPEWNVGAGLAFMWNPDFSRLGQASVWLVAAGQIFFTLSLGQGIIATYASYLRERDDVALNGLTTSMTNEFAEVILGGTIAIPVAVAFFGVAETQLIAQNGAFDLGFRALPVVFQKLPLGQLFGAMWFFLLFIAGITSSVAMASPAVSFLEDEFDWPRRKAVNAVFVALAACMAAVVAFFKYGFLDELDFWAGTFGLVVFAVIEIVIFSWLFGAERGFAELEKGAELKIPRAVKFVLKYVTPVYLLGILVVWTYQDAVDKLLMVGEDPARLPYLWGARLLFAGVIATCLLLIRVAWRRRPAGRRRDGEVGEEAL
jgi:SNF family Na+-dependent transporter